MISKKLIKIVSLSLCITISSIGVAFAENLPEPRKMMQSSVENDNMIQLQSEIDAPDAPASSTVVEIDKAIYDKQVEIDKILFEDNKEKMTDMGFSVTHTFPTEEYVEIGIAPYNDENAEFIYELLGNDMIKVVEGVKGVMTLDSISTDGVQENDVQTVSSTEEAPQVTSVEEDSVQTVSTTSAEAKDESADKFSPIYIGIGAAIILGLIAALRKQKTVRR